MTQPRPDTDAAVAFLQLFCPNGPWLLTAIEPDRSGIETRTFTGLAQRSHMREWIGRWNGRRNLYFSVNPPLRPLDKKAEKEDMAAMSWLHVDVDPRAGEDPAAERDRIRELFTTKLPRGVPPPTFVIFSGGGYQGFWKLSEPLPINGEKDKYEDAERYNKQLELVFGGDHCFNIDRIMRLPGSVNLPDAKKLKKGRVPMLATLLPGYDINRVYALAQFEQAPLPRVISTGTTDSAAPVIDIADVKRLESVDELDTWPMVPNLDRVKVVIVQGYDPDNPKPRDNSRSAWVFDVACNLVRGDVPDHVIFSVLTDPKFRISDSVLGQGTQYKAERYALRQIARAREHAVDPWLARLNSEHFVVMNFGGKCRVMQEIPDPAFGGRLRLTKQTFEDFKNAYLNELVQVGTNKSGDPIWSPVGKWWLAHKRRRQYKHVVFAPGRDIEGAYNLWQGFAVEPREGDCSLFLGHIRDNICSGNAEHYDYLTRWMARAVQKPDSPGLIAVVMRGGRGVGKSFFAKMFGSLFGRHFLQVSDPKHLVGSFNAHLRDCVILFGDEAFYAGDKKHESVLKTLITEETQAIEAKGVDVEQAPNFTHVILASNDDWAAPAGPMERRFFVLDVGDRRIQDETYFQRVADQMENGGRAALLHQLMHLDIQKWNVRAVPKTDALRDLQALSMPDYVAEFISIAQIGATPDDPSRKPGPEWMSTHALYELLGRRDAKPVSAQTEIGMWLRRFMTKATQVRRETYRLGQLKPLPEVRAELTKLYGVRFDDSRVTHWVMKPGDPQPKVDPRQLALEGREPEAGDRPEAGNCFMGEGK